MYGLNRGDARATAQPNARDRSSGDTFMPPSMSPAEHLVSWSDARPLLDSRTASYSREFRTERDRVDRYGGKRAWNDQGALPQILVSEQTSKLWPPGRSPYSAENGRYDAFSRKGKGDEDRDGESSLSGSSLGPNLNRAPLVSSLPSVEVCSDALSAKNSTVPGVTKVRNFIPSVEPVSESPASLWDSSSSLGYLPKPRLALGNRSGSRDLVRALSDKNLWSRESPGTVASPRDFADNFMGEGNSESSVSEKGLLWGSERDSTPVSSLSKDVSSRSWRAYGSNNAGTSGSKRFGGSEPNPPSQTPSSRNIFEPSGGGEKSGVSNGPLQNPQTNSIIEGKPAINGSMEASGGGGVLHLPKRTRLGWGQGLAKFERKKEPDEPAVSAGDDRDGCSVLAAEPGVERGGEEGGSTVSARENKEIIPQLNLERADVCAESEGHVEKVPSASVQLRTEGMEASAIEASLPNELYCEGKDRVEHEDGGLASGAMEVLIGEGETCVKGGAGSSILILSTEGNCLKASDVGGHLEDLAVVTCDPVAMEGKGEKGSLVQECSNLSRIDSDATSTFLPVLKTDLGSFTSLELSEHVSFGESEPYLKTYSDAKELMVEDHVEESSLDGIKSLLEDKSFVPLETVHAVEEKAAEKVSEDIHSSALLLEKEKKEWGGEETVEMQYGTSETGREDVEEKEEGNWRQADILLEMDAVDVEIESLEAEMRDLVRVEETLAAQLKMFRKEEQRRASSPDGPLGRQNSCAGLVSCDESNDATAAMAMKMILDVGHSQEALQNSALIQEHQICTEEGEKVKEAVLETEQMELCELPIGQDDSLSAPSLGDSEDGGEQDWEAENSLDAGPSPRCSEPLSWCDADGKSLLHRLVPPPSQTSPSSASLSAPPLHPFLLEALLLEQDRLCVRRVLSENARRAAGSGFWEEQADGSPTSHACPQEAPRWASNEDSHRNLRGKLLERLAGERRLQAAVNQAMAVKYVAMRDSWHADLTAAQQQQQLQLQQLQLQLQFQLPQHIGGGFGGHGLVGKRGERWGREKVAVGGKNGGKHGVSHGFQLNPRASLRLKITSPLSEPNPLSSSLSSSLSDLPPASSSSSSSSRLLRLMEEAMAAQECAAEAPRPTPWLQRMPPMLLGRQSQQRQKFVCSNSRVEDPKALEEERKSVCVWTPEERSAFLHHYSLLHKDFAAIAAHLERKTTADCVEFYYRNQKSADFQKLRHKKQGHLSHHLQQQKPQPHHYLHSQQQKQQQQQVGGPGKRRREGRSASASASASPAYLAPGSSASHRQQLQRDARNRHMALAHSLARPSSGKSIASASMALPSARERISLPSAILPSSLPPVPLSARAGGAGKGLGTSSPAESSGGGVSPGWRSAGGATGPGQELPCFVLALEAEVVLPTLPTASPPLPAPGGEALPGAVAGQAEEEEEEEAEEEDGDTEGTACVTVSAMEGVVEAEELEESAVSLSVVLECKERDAVEGGGGAPSLPSDPPPPSPFFPAMPSSSSVSSVNRPTPPPGALGEPEDSPAAPDLPPSAPPLPSPLPLPQPCQAEQGAAPPLQRSLAPSSKLPVVRRPHPPSPSASAPAAASSASPAVSSESGGKGPKNGPALGSGVAAAAGGGGGGGGGGRGGGKRDGVALWLASEKALFAEVVAQYGRSWDRLAEVLPDKSMPQIKAYFQNSKQRKGGGAAAASAGLPPVPGGMPGRKRKGLAGGGGGEAECAGKKEKKEKKERKEKKGKEKKRKQDAEAAAVAGDTVKEEAVEEAAERKAEQQELQPGRFLVAMEASLDPSPANTPPPPLLPPLPTHSPLPAPTEAPSASDPSPSRTSSQEEPPRERDFSGTPPMFSTEPSPPSSLSPAPLTTVNSSSGSMGGMGMSHMMGLGMNHMMGMGMGMGMGGMNGGMGMMGGYPHPHHLPPHLPHSSYEQPQYSGGAPPPASSPAFSPFSVQVPGPPQAGPPSEAGGGLPPPHHLQQQQQQQQQHAAAVAAAAYASLQQQVHLVMQLQHQQQQQQQQQHHMGARSSSGVSSASPPPGRALSAPPEAHNAAMFAAPPAMGAGEMAHHHHQQQHQQATFQELLHGSMGQPGGAINTSFSSPSLPSLGIGGHGEAPGLAMAASSHPSSSTNHHLFRAISQPSLLGEEADGRCQVAPHRASTPDVKLFGQSLLSQPPPKPPKLPKPEDSAAAVASASAPATALGMGGGSREREAEKEEWRRSGGGSLGQWQNGWMERGNKTRSPSRSSSRGEEGVGVGRFGFVDMMQQWKGGGEEKAGRDEEVEKGNLEGGRFSRESSGRGREEGGGGKGLAADWLSVSSGGAAGATGSSRWGPGPGRQEEVMMGYLGSLKKAGEEQWRESLEERGSREQQQQARQSSLGADHGSSMMALAIAALQQQQQQQQQQQGQSARSPNRFLGVGEQYPDNLKDVGGGNPEHR